MSKRWKTFIKAINSAALDAFHSLRTDRFLMTIFCGTIFLATGFTTTFFGGGATFFTTGFGAGLTGAAFATTFGAGLATTFGAALATTFGAGLATGFGSGLAMAFVAAGLAAATTFFTGAATAFFGATATVFGAAFAGAFFPTAKVIGVGVNADAELARIANTANFMVIILIQI